ncbi:uncharacterized protein K444DRAFT_636302 [Hyaloscypha bicolor E]|uniref:Rhodopsin domain-containing protein n=1 Tax=Hyaloscypha bicolor E TaxID=1095630 RepID=A0A2J6SNV5_9HELO|nr:uncharacterized protein K444DRAFT_636302 [Hyaloscypha bicolor E]PMD52449.1 hypothetical protein K444DRAFT_636302 [Hyaloscypha bicolor E]
MPPPNPLHKMSICSKRRKRSERSQSKPPSEIERARFNHAASTVLPCILNNIFATALIDVQTLSNALCSNTTRLSHVSVCVQTSCTWPDQVNASRAESKFCAGFPIESRSNHLIVLAAVLSVVIFPIVGLKLWMRWTTSHRLWADDYTALVAAICLAAIAGCDIAAASMGLGKHYWNINPEHYTPLYQSNSLRMFYASQIIYVAVQVFAKTSILLLYLRVFTHCWFTIACNLCIVFLVLHGIAFTLAVSFQCKPVKSLWNPRVTGKCINLTATGVAGAIISIVEDLVILILPIPEIINLQMNKSKKWGLVLLFGIGSFACLTSGIRLKYFMNFGKSLDPTWAYINVVKWSIIEEFTAVLCTALPSMCAVFRHTFGLLTDGLQSLTGSFTTRRDHSQPSGDKASSCQSLTIHPKHRYPSLVDLALEIG